MAGGFDPRVFVIIYRNVVARSALRTEFIVISDRGSLRAVAENSSHAAARIYIADSSRTDFSVRGNPAASDIEHGVVERIADVKSRSVAAGAHVVIFIVVRSRGRRLNGSYRVIVFGLNDADFQQIFRAVIDVKGVVSERSARVRGSHAVLSRGNVHVAIEKVFRFVCGQNVMDDIFCAMAVNISDRAACENRARRIYVRRTRFYLDPSFVA